MKSFKQFYTEGLWANINKKKKSGRKSASKGSKAYKAAKKAGDKLEATKESVNENFKDGKKKGKSRPGRVKRSGASCSGSVTSLRKRLNQVVRKVKCITGVPT